MRTSLADEFAVCSQCRLCIDLCDVFPSVFDAVAILKDGDPHLLTPQQQNIVSDLCFHCGACVQRCPNRGPSSEYDIDLPTSFVDLMEVRHMNGYFTVRQRFTNWLLSSPDVIGPIASRCSRLSNWLLQHPNTLRRRLITALTGISPSARIPQVSGERFSQWRRRQELHEAVDLPRVSLFASCGAEYFSDETARDIVRALTSQGRSCHLATTRCCGAEELRSGRVRAFRKRVRRLVTLFAEEPATDPIIVMSPSCLAHLRTNLVPHCEAAQKLTAEAVVNRLRSPLEVFAEFATTDTDEACLNSNDAPGPSLLFLPGPYEGQSEREAFEQGVGTGTTTQTIDDAGTSMGAWALRHGNEENVRRNVQRMAKRLPPTTTSPQTVARSGLLSSQALSDATGFNIVDPAVILLRTTSDEQ